MKVTGEGGHWSVGGYNMVVVVLVVVLVLVVAAVVVVFFSGANTFSAKRAPSSMMAFMRSSVASS